MKEKTYAIFGKHVLSDEEKAEKSAQMAEALNTLQIREDEKKAVVKQISGEIDELNSRARKLGGHIRDGFEMKMITCTMDLDYPGKRKIYRSIETQEIVKIERMSAEEQLEMTS